jgi:LysM repeat protein
MKTLGFVALSGAALAVGLAVPTAASAATIHTATAIHTTTTIRSTASTTSCEYTVQPGDWLSHIAPNFGLSWGTLYAMNRQTIGGDPNLIFPGQRLQTCGTATNQTTQSPATYTKPAPAPTTPPAPAPSGSVQQMIAQTFGGYTWQALAVARCESGFDPGAYNPTAVWYNGSNLGHAMGVFQIVNATWASTSYSGYSPYNAWANIQAAHQIFARDGYTWREWACQP